MSDTQASATDEAELTALEVEKARFISGSYALGGDLGSLLSRLGVSDHALALVGLRLIHGALAGLVSVDKEQATALARFIGQEMVSGVTELGLRGDGKADGAEKQH